MIRLRANTKFLHNQFCAVNTDIIRLHIIFTILAIIVNDEGYLCTKNNLDQKHNQLYSTVTLTPSETLC